MIDQLLGLVDLELDAKPVSAEYRFDASLMSSHRANVYHLPLAELVTPELGDLGQFRLHGGERGGKAILLVRVS